MEKIPRSIGTHDGTFHADEVTATALLVLVGRVDPEQVFRTRDANVLARCEYVCDVGGEYKPEKKHFDHHQVEYQGDYSSAGMVLKYLRDQGDLDEGTYEYFNNSLVIGVDAHDNGRDPQRLGFCSFSNVIQNFTPVDYDAPPEEQDAAFHVAMNFTLNHLKRLLKRYEYLQSCKDAIRAAMNPPNESMVFDHAMPWQEIFFSMGGESHPALFLIMPSGKHWKLRGVPPSLDKRMDVRLPLPAEWAGLMGPELKKASGIDGAIFCHKGRFISVWETREDAMKALDYCLQRQRSGS